MTLHFLGFYLILTAANVVLIRGMQFAHRLTFGTAFTSRMRTRAEGFFPTRFRPRVSRLIDHWFAHWWHLATALLIVGALLMAIDALL
jgi:hypothetical protein